MADSHVSTSTSPSSSSVPASTSISTSIPLSVPPPSTPPPANRPRRIYHYSSPKARIDDILETGRRRSITAMATNDQQQQQQQQPVPAPSMSPGQTARLSDQEGEGTESSADEFTAIFRQQSSSSSSRRPNYQSTNISAPTAADNGAAAVRRRTAQDRRPLQNAAAATAAVADSESESQQSWWKKQVEKFGSIELENKGSVARDHLALERTFLAWLRTSLAFASIGIAVTQLFRLNITSLDPDSSDDPYFHLRQLGKPLGATFLGISILILFVGFHRYFESQHWIIRGKFPASRGSIAVVAAVTLALMVASLIVVVVVEPSAFEKRKR